MTKVNTYMLKTIFTFALLLAACCYIFAQKSETGKIKTKKAQIIAGENDEVKTADITQKRDMTQYRQGGNFDCRTYSFGRAKGVCDENKFREFIWRNWSEKKRGYVRLTSNSPDAGGTLHYFIEPDKSGKWTIVVRLVRWSALPPGKSEIVDYPKIFSLERIESKTKKEDWTLVFKNKFGEIISEY